MKASFRTLIERVEWIVAIAGDFCQAYRSSSNRELSAVALELQTYLPSMQTVTVTARRANVAGETVPANERVFQPVRTAHGVDQAWAAAEAGGVRPQGVVVRNGGEVYHRLRGL